MDWKGGNAGRNSGGGRHSGRGGGGRGGNTPSSGRGRGDGGGDGWERGASAGRGGRGNDGNGGKGSGGRGQSQGGRSSQPPSRTTPPPPPPATRATPPSTPVWGAPPVAPPPAPIQQLSQSLEEQATISSPPQEEMEYSMSLAHRNQGGKAGKPVVLLANHFRVKYTPPDDIYRYDVEFKEDNEKRVGEQGGVPPKPLAERLMKGLLAQLKIQFPTSTIVSDFRKNVFSAARIPFQGILNVTGIDIGERRGADQESVLFQAIIKPVESEAFRMSQIEEFMSGRMNTTPHDAIQALDVVLRHLGAQRMTMVGRNFFHGNGAKSIGGGAEAWSGYFQSLRPTQNGMIINLDVASTAFVRAMPALEFIAELCATYNNTSTPQSLSPVQYKTVHKTVRGIKVEANHLPNQRRSYRVNGLSPKSANETYFEDENGRRVSIVQYFQQKYQRRLQYPNLPCLHVGAMDKKTYLPIEICHIVAGTKVPRKLNEEQTAAMIKITATHPDKRRENIDRLARDANYDGDATLRAFGMTVDPRMVQVTGRVLSAPSVVYGRNQSEQPRDGVWNMRNKQYFKPAPLVSCAIINTDFKLNPRAIETFFKALMNEATNLGMGKLPKMPPIINQGRNDLISDLYYEAIEAGKRTFNNQTPQIIFMINPRQNAESYGALKMASDLQYGIPSQCMLSKHVLKVNGQYLGNILLKVNTKLGGCNSTLQPSAFPAKIHQQKTIIFGADVTHGTPQDNRPSIAALIGSLNKDFTRHASTIHVQGHREEEMVNLAEMVKSLLKAFYRENRDKPRQIVFFRDGVSEGQFQMVLNKEVTAIRKACASLENGYQPPITFVIVQKRHHTRFFGTKANEVDKSGNIRAGTVIDTGVCHPAEDDFYLMSHAGLQGTSRPTHYQVLMDEIGFSSDEIQKLTNNLTYTYARCTRSVSLVPSTYYSHLLAFRARFFMGDDFSDTESSTSNYSVKAKTTDIHENLLRTMFYV